MEIVVAVSSCGSKLAVSENFEGLFILNFDGLYSRVDLFHKIAQNLATEMREDEMTKGQNR